MREPRSQCFSPQINNWHSWQLKISKSWGLVWRYQLNSAASLANLAYFLGKWAGLAVLFSWYVAPKWPQDFDFFNCHGADYSFEVISNKRQKGLANFYRTFFFGNVAMCSICLWPNGAQSRLIDIDLQQQRYKRKNMIP